MKKKTKKDYFKAIGIILLFVIILVGFALLYPKFHKTEFTIYKEECRNEEMEIGKPILIRDYEISIDGKTKRIKEYIKSNNNTTMIICKKVEVNEMIIPKKEFLRVCYKEFDNETCQDLWIEAIKNHGYKMPSMTKDRFTITWLDENCECFKFPEGCLEKSFTNNEAKDCCIEYKCNNYYVEVKE